MFQSVLHIMACCALLTTVAAYGSSSSRVTTELTNGNNEGFSVSAFGSASSGPLAGLSQDQIDGQLANLQTGDVISINNVRYTALRSENNAGRPNTMILVESQRQMANQDSYSVTDSKIRNAVLNNNLGFSSAVPFGAGSTAKDAGQGSRQSQIVGFGSSYSAPPAVSRLQNVNSVSAVNDPSTYSTPSNGIRQSAAGQQSYSSASPSKVRLQNDQQQSWDYSDTIPGVAGQDYPILSEVGRTIFNCNGRREGGYYADVDSGCQVYHICALNNKFSFLCPNGTIFDQRVFVCNWWYNVDCAGSSNYYNLNDQIGVAPSDNLFGLPDGPRTQQPGKLSTSSAY